MIKTDAEELKRQPGVLSLYSSRVQLKKDNQEYVGRCIFHDEKTPSFRVSLYKDYWVFKCFGCGVSGDVISFVCRTDGIPFKEAVEKIKTELGQSFSQTKKAEQTFSSLSESKPATSYSLKEYSKYEKALETSQAGLAWLVSRGISYEVAKKAHIGFRQDVGKLSKEGLKNWMSFPSVMGDRVLSIKYRNIGEKTFCKQPGMSKGDQTPLFNSETIEPLEPVYLVEGEPDCLVMEQAGFKSVSVQSSSTPLTAANKEKLLEADYIVLAGDNTPDGNAYMDKAWSEIQERTYKITWPLKDANQVFLETCKGDIIKFRELVQELTLQAKTKPMPGMYSLQEAMRASGRTNMADNPSRLRFPWEAVDKMVNIVPGTTLSVFATSTGMGKTTWTMQVLLDAALRGGVILNYSAELSCEEYANIVTACILKKDRNHLSKEDYHTASLKLGDARFYIGRDPDLSTADQVLDLIEAGIRRLSPTIVVIDHIHYICRNESDTIRAQENACQRIKRMAVKYGVIFIIIGQPRKANQQTRGKVVQISDAKGSESYTSDADAVIAIHRDTAKADDPSNPPKEPYSPVTEIHLLKGRSQGTGNAYTQLMFNGSICTFFSMTKEEPQDSKLFKGEQ